jgi:DNA recombination protein RmuC
MPASVLAFLTGLVLGSVSVLLLWLWSRQETAARLARLEAERDAAAKAREDQLSILTQTQADVRDAFAAVSRDALSDTRMELLQSADALLGPVRQTLERVRTHLADVDRAREGSHQALSAELRSVARAQDQLRSATEGLTSALRSPNVRGRWGEVQLRRIVELAGMLHQCDFTEKPSATTAEGQRQTPDLVVHLPGGSTIVVDAKVPIDAYLSAATAGADDERSALLTAHTRQVKDHIRALGAKEYWKQFEASPEFVVMFLPLEPLLSAAFEQDGTLLDQAAALRVIPATPTTLLALLKTIAFGWQQQAMAANAAEIQQLGRELYERLVVMVHHIDSVGGSIKAAADSYDKLVGSLEQKVFPAARRFRDLGVPATRIIDPPDQLSLSLRRPRREEGGERSPEGEIVQAESRFRG